LVASSLITYFSLAASQRFRLRKEHRRPQGVIEGKRCGTTKNLGPAARQRAVSGHQGVKCGSVAADSCQSFGCAQLAAFNKLGSNAFDGAPHGGSRKIA
jgi:hypothetical protein